MACTGPNTSLRARSLWWSTSPSTVGATNHPAARSPPSRSPAGQQLGPVRPGPVRWWPGCAPWPPRSPPGPRRSPGRAGPRRPGIPARRPPARPPRRRRRRGRRAGSGSAHPWPASSAVPKQALVAAVSRSASGNTMLGDLPPSSRARGVRLPAADRHQGAGGGAAPGEADLVHPGVTGQSRSGLGPAHHHVEHSLGQARPPAPARRSAASRTGTPRAAWPPRCCRRPGAGPHFWPIPIIEPFHGGITATTP